MDIHSRESALLSSYAMRSANSRGRKYPESEHPYRGPYQRDRDRILHSAAFRRLSGKMQVFTGDHGDYHRTRLTHTMEVSSIARTIARALGLNEDLVEALALLHDIGHPPFGHAGEDALSECLQTEGGFSHNRHALTLVETLERPHPGFPGLNLTRETLAGQQSRIDKSRATNRPILEVQVVDAADSITYNAHDTDDAIKLGIVPADEVLAVPLAHQAYQRVQQRGLALDNEMLRKAVVHELIDYQVSSLIEHSRDFLRACQWTRAEDATASDFVLAPAPEVCRQKAELESYLYQQVYRHEDLLRIRRRAQDQLRRMWEFYVAHPERLPAETRLRCESEGTARAAAEYVAGMTDRFCQQQFERWIGQ